MRHIAFGCSPCTEKKDDGCHTEEISRAKNIQPRSRLKSRIRQVSSVILLSLAICSGQTVTFTSLLTTPPPPALGSSRTSTNPSHQKAIYPLEMVRNVRGPGRVQLLGESVLCGPINLNPTLPSKSFLPSFRSSDEIRAFEVTFLRSGLINSITKERDPSGAFSSGNSLALGGGSLVVHPGIHLDRAYIANTSAQHYFLSRLLLDLRSEVFDWVFVTSASVLNVVRDSRDRKSVV